MELFQEKEGLCNTNNKQVFSEVLAVINALPQDYKDKLPVDLLQSFENEQDMDYTIEINENIPLEEQNLSKESIDILAYLKLNYWCENDDKYKEFLQLLIDNEK